MPAYRKKMWNNNNNALITYFRTDTFFCVSNSLFIATSNWRFNFANSCSVPSFSHSFIHSSKQHSNDTSTNILVKFQFLFLLFANFFWVWRLKMEKKRKKNFLIFMWKRVHVKAASSIIVVVKSLRDGGKSLQKKNFLVHQLKQYCRFLLIITRVAHSHSLSTSSNEIQLMHPHMNEVTYRVVFPLYYFIFLRPYTRRFLWLC